jgi:hypothetical protein
MFDYYSPDPPLRCPVCGAELEGWQGKDGPCGLFIWKQGLEAPVEQSLAGAHALSADQLRQFRLPDRFRFHTDDPQHWIVAEGTAVNGVWKETSILEVKPLTNAA